MKTTSPDPPPDIYGLIAEALVFEKLFKSCASLNAVSRVAYAGTLPVLWKTVNLDRDFQGSPQLNSVCPTGGGKEVFRWLTEQCSKANRASCIRSVQDGHYSGLPARPQLRPGSDFKTRFQVYSFAEIHRGDSARL